MLMGRPVRQAEVFYFQPFYPYFLAAAHALFGEDAFGAFLLQRFGLWLALALVGSSTRRLFGNVVAMGAVVAGALFIYLKVLHWSSGRCRKCSSFHSSACRSAVRLRWPRGRQPRCDRHRPGRRSCHADAVDVRDRLDSRLTLDVLRAPPTRCSIECAAAQRDRARRCHQPCDNPERGRIPSIRPYGEQRALVLLLGDPPPPGTPTHTDQPHAVLRWLQLDDRTQSVAEGALPEPAAFAANLVSERRSDTLGFFGAYVPGTGWSPILVVTWSAALIGLSRASICRRCARADEWLPAVFAASHFAAVTLFVPHVYADRLILPFYMLILPYVGVFVDPIWRARSCGPIDWRPSAGRTLGHGDARITRWRARSAIVARQHTRERHALRQWDGDRIDAARHRDEA